ncbi:MAG: Nif3-like dinuclear metal center hexameric protein [Patescibacteria group bacterium]
MGTAPRRCCAEIVFHPNARGAFFSIRPVYCTRGWRAIILAELSRRLDEAVPARWAEPWDNTGLTVGDPAADVTRVLVALEVTGEIIREALARDCSLILTHHPFPWRETRKYDLREPDPVLLAEVFRHGLNLYAAHTNLDAAPFGHAATLAREFGMVNTKPLRISSPCANELPSLPGESVGIGRVGEIEPVSAMALVEKTRRLLSLASYRLAGMPQNRVERLAVCPGSAGDYIGDAASAGAQLLIGGDFNHHQAAEALQRGLMLLDAGHYATEKPAVDVLARLCMDLAGGDGVEVYRAGQDRDPFYRSWNSFT